jgi:beta-N-acetylhexosaminidase
LAEQVGQLLMVGIPAQGASSQLLAELASLHVGNVFLVGRNARGVRSTADVTRAARDELIRGSSGVPLLVGTDQEGGAVQALSGPGFSTIPSALSQGSWPAPLLRRSARRWAQQLREGGVNLDLAPVGDIVPRSPDPRTNAPIGYFNRQFGANAKVVRSHTIAFVRGMSGVHVGTAVKHFPGLGYVRGNTDTSSSVVDSVVGPTDPGLGVFRDAARAGSTMVMASTATYRRLDPSLPAAFSPVVVRQLLRHRLGFSGVVISDDLGAARQVQRWTPGQRVDMFIAAGGDVALTVVPQDASKMAHDLVAAAQHSVAIRHRIRRAANRVLLFKARLGLLAER